MSKFILNDRNPNPFNISIGDKVISSDRGLLSKEVLLVLRVLPSNRWKSGWSVTTLFGVLNKWVGVIYLDAEKCSLAPLDAELSYDPRLCRIGVKKLSSMRMSNLSKLKY